MLFVQVMHMTNIINTKVINVVVLSELSKYMPCSGNFVNSVLIIQILNLNKFSFRCNLSQFNLVLNCGFKFVVWQTLGRFAPSAFGSLNKA